MKKALLIIVLAAIATLQMKAALPPSDWAMGAPYGSASLEIKSQGNT